MCGTTQNIPLLLLLLLLLDRGPLLQTAGCLVDLYDCCADFAAWDGLYRCKFMYIHFCGGWNTPFCNYAFFAGQLAARKSMRASVSNVVCYLNI